MQVKNVGLLIHWMRTFEEQKSRIYNRIWFCVVLIVVAANVVRLVTNKHVGESIPEWLFAELPVEQCDQIWQKFATMAKL